MSSPTPPPMGGAPPQGQPPAQPGAPPSAAPASPIQVMLAQMFQVCKKLSMENPIVASGMNKAAEGIQEAQTAMLTQTPSPGPEQSPPY